MTASSEELLRNALDGALDRYALVMGEAFSGTVHLTFVDAPDFVAMACPEDNGVEIVVSAGVVTAIDGLWAKALRLSSGMPDEYQLNVLDQDEAVHASLVWLMLHEMHHYQIGHLDLVGPAGVSETSVPPELGLTSRSSKRTRPSLLRQLPETERLLILRCLELQADHDALEILLDHYSDQGWDYIRYYMATAMAVMMVIDQQDRANDQQMTHPKSATRVFQLIGALATLWQPTPTSERQAPENDEIDAYYGAVILPAIGDAIILAMVAETPSILQSLDQSDDLFLDIHKLQSPDDIDLTQLKTAGAREYAALLPSNAKAKTLLGPEKFFI